ncbi:hypothetical protein F5B21DRAFT_113155 [Xylaria acuta]|nr:hypothetical protein F5B21DRAFT_113155 [Xylaria acuta]
MVSLCPSSSWMFFNPPSWLSTLNYENKCQCGSKYTRPDALQRHILRHTKAPAYPCLLCNRQGPKAFHRAAHLAQHMRHKHRSHGLAGYRPQERAPAQVSHTPDLTVTLLPFSCMEPGCPRWGQDGFVRRIDLDEHMLVHALLQGPMPHQPGPAYPNVFPIFPMNNVFGRGRGYNFQQDTLFQPMWNSFEDGGYGISMAGEEENNFQPHTNYGPAEDPLHHAGCGMNVANGHGNDFRRRMTYEPAGDLPQLGGF